MFCFSCDRILSLGHKDRFQGIGSIEDELYAGVLKVFLNFSLRPGIQETEMRTFFLTSRPASVYKIGVDGFFK